MKIAIIGGSGKMGQWFASYLLKEGMQVVITGRNQEKLRAAGKKLGVPVATNTEAVKLADAVILSVPLDTFETVVKEIAPHTRHEQVIVDVTSLKTLPVELMHLYLKRGAILGIHPVFGPGAKGTANQNFVLTPTGENDNILADKVKQYLEARGANVSIMTPQEHDHLMSVVLGLAHFIAIVSADTLLSFDKFQEMKKIGGTTFKVLYTLIESVISEDPELYASLQMNFPGISKIEELFLLNSGIWADMVKTKDKQEFAKRMNALRGKLEKTDPAFRSAYENMYRITEKL
ncbi:MAG: prephenate dehydrogenase [Dehalococcoidales bacterium]|nr:prephenate dehydrogenase [Dehalococcoidales bacterium]